MHVFPKVCVRYLCVVVGFSLLGLSVAGEVVQSAVLHEGCEGEDEADGHEQVHGSDVGHFGQGLPGDGAERCHGEHCGDACMDCRRQTGERLAEVFIKSTKRLWSVAEKEQESPKSDFKNEVRRSNQFKIYEMQFYREKLHQTHNFGSFMNLLEAPPNKI